MAARTRKQRIDDLTRTRIKTSQLLNRLTNHGLGKIDMTGTQVRACEVVLRKVLPDLSTQQIEGHVEHSFADILRQIDTIRRQELNGSGLGDGILTIDAQATPVRN